MRVNERIKLLLYGSNLWYLGEGMLGPLFAIFAERIGGDVLDITWAWATYLIVTGILLIFVGKISDKKLDKKKVLVVGYFLNALFTFGYLFISAPWHLFIVQAGLGLAAALASPTWNALYSKYEDKKSETFEWGLADGTAQITTAIAIIIGGLIVSYISFTVLFITMGIIQVIAAFTQLSILRKRKR